MWTGSGPARVSKGGGFLRRLLIVLLILAGLALAGTVFRPSSGNTARATDRPAAAAWSVPAGFTRYAGDPNVAWRWAEKGEVTCDVGDSCWGMFVVAKDGCSSLYVEVSIIDSAGTAIDYSNDTTSALEPGQQAKLEFQSFDDGADKARLTQISC